MFGWLSQHSDILSIFTTVGSIIIWLGFSQYLYTEMRRRRHPRLLINGGKRRDTHALCIISNMSDEPVMVEYLIAELETSQGRITQEISGTVVSLSNSQQGPLNANDFFHIGTFDRIIRHLADGEGIKMDGHRPEGNVRFRSLTVRLIGIYGPESLPFAAQRCFRLKQKESYCILSPATPDTPQFINRWQRHRVRKWIEEINRGDASFSRSAR
nr:hypothetical protein [uncultured Halomonas sp.]